MSFCRKELAALGRKGRNSAPQAAETHLALLYVEVCGWTLARAHARTGDPALISGYLGRNGSFDSALAQFGPGSGTVAVCFSPMESLELEEPVPASATSLQIVAF